MIASAGNDAVSTSFPASNDSVMGIGAITSSNTLASFSNYGDLDVVAPGANIMAPVKYAENGFLVYDFQFRDGTSLSTPMVSVLAANIMTQNLFLNAKDVRCIIDTTAVINPVYSSVWERSYNWDNFNSQEKRSYSNLVGFGTIQPIAAIEAARRKLPKFYIDDFDEGTNYVNVKLKIDNFYNEKLSQYDKYVKTSKYIIDASYERTWRIIYGPYNRNFNLDEPSINSFDTDKEYGGVKEYKIGLITLDEANIAGASLENNENYYLY